MRILGFTIIRSANHDAFVASHKYRGEEVHRLSHDIIARLDSESSLRRTVANHEETIEALKVKCSRVNVSALENEIARLKNEALPGIKLSSPDQLELDILPGSLVQPTEGTAQLDTRHGKEPGEGFDLTFDEETRSGNVAESTGDK